MYRQMLEMVAERSASVLSERQSPSMLFRNEWAKLFLKAYEPDRKVIYTSVYAFPMELLAAFDVVPFDFEVAGAMMSNLGAGVDMMKTAEDRGYAMDVCSFHRCSLGASFNGHFPEPDLLLTTSYYCDQKAKTNELLSRFYGREPFLVYAPWEITLESVRYVETQLREVAEKLGEITGDPLDEDRLKEAVRSSNRARESHLKLLERLKHRPAPCGGADLIAFSINGLMFTGTEVKERLNEAYLEFMEKNIRSGEGRAEEHRVYWFAWLPVYDAGLFDALSEKKVAVPLCETFRVFWDEIDEDRPFEGLALKCLRNPFVGPVTRRLQGLAGIVAEYGLDGALAFATPACRHANSAYRVLKDRFAEEGLPFLLLDMDISDPRGHSKEQMKVRVEGFVELMAQKDVE
jgi:benzoyl-CoA reductase/2-hydroxyglutaryl-CoA dehydratase subunit BcrC/BadD/HgdB